MQRVRVCLRTLSYLGAADKQIPEHWSYRSRTQTLHTDDRRRMEGQQRGQQSCNLTLRKFKPASHSIASYVYCYFCAHRPQPSPFTPPPADSSPMTADDATDIPASVWPEFSRVMVIDAITLSRTSSSSCTLWVVLLYQRGSRDGCLQVL
jgi:hypothetical protein